MNAIDTATFWDGFYADRAEGPVPRPNARLTETVAGLPPGEALDLGCGQGGDALWLARRGWRVTAVDVSGVAVERLDRLARSHGLGEEITTERHDLGETFPHGTFDLVSVQYLHTPLALDRSAVLRAAAHALRPGGLLLVVDHGSTALWSWARDPGVRYPGPRDVAADIGLDPRSWTVERSDSPRRTATGPGGRAAEVVDHVLLVRRTTRTARTARTTRTTRTGAASREVSPPAPHRRERHGDTPPPRTGAGEADVLRGFLDYLRTSVAAKVAGAPEPHVRTAAVPSGTDLLGLLHHLTHVERATFLAEEVTDWQATFHAAPHDTVADVVARYRAAVGDANDVLDACPDLGAPLPRSRPGRATPSVRWALAHMIEETGRHAGHADVLRELIDGTTGR